MKTELLNPKLMLATAAAATLLAGCASPNPGYSDITGPPSAVSFTTATDPKQLIKWTEDPFIFRGLRSIDTYYFQVPDTGYNPGGRVGAAGAPATYTTGTGSSDQMNGVTVTGPYESATGGYKIIEYRPGMP